MIRKYLQKDYLLISMNFKKMKFILILLLCSMLLPLQMHAKVVINEIMADNETTIADHKDEYCDWIEIYNGFDYPVSLAGFGLTDEPTQPWKWKFPDIVIPAKGFILVFASGTGINEHEELHANFKISSDGEVIALYDNMGHEIDAYHPIELDEDEAYGRWEDGAYKLAILPMPSPGRSNTLTDKLSFSDESGFYESPFDLKIESLKENAIHYTTDGSLPTAEDMMFNEKLSIDYRYDVPNYFSNIPTTSDISINGYDVWQVPAVVLSKANILRFASFSGDKITSKIYTKTFFVDSNIFDKYDLPIVSIVAQEADLFGDEKGILVPGDLYDSTATPYYANFNQRGREWERPIHIEYFDEKGNVGFAQNAGIRIHGSSTRYAPQKSLRIYARNEYGKKFFNYKLMPQLEIDEYKRFIISSIEESWGQKLGFVDIFAHEISRPLGLDFQNYRPAILFINGEYWGIHTIKERQDEWYLASRLDIDEESFDIVENHAYPRASTGTITDYVDLMEYIEQHDLSNQSNYEFVLSKIDLNNYLNYQVTEMFFSNYDWPNNNMKYWKLRGPEGKWRWFFYDLGSAFFKLDLDMFEHCTLNDSTVWWPNSSQSTFLFRNLMKNDSFRTAFIDRYAKLLNNEFQKERMIEIFYEMKEMFENEIPRQVERWHNPESKADWDNKYTDIMLNFLNERPCIVEGQIIGFFDLDKFDFDCEGNSVDPSEDISISIAPNPNNGNFSIQNTNDIVLECNIEIFSYTGRKVFERKNIILGANHNYPIELNGLPTELYLIRLSGKKFSEVLKVLIVSK
jgi:CotH protein/lamin tail-like protein/type IX secretion system substrate protein